MPRIITEAEVCANIAQVISQAANGEGFFISRGNAPGVRLTPAQTAVGDRAEKTQEEAFAAIKQWHKRIIGSPMTIDEIISARDEGRKY